MLGQCFMEKGEPDAAVRTLKRALEAPYEIEDELLGIYYYLGRAFEQLGNTKEALRMLASGEINAYGTNRARVEDLAAANPGVRALPDNFFAVEQSIVVSKGNSAGLEIINRFLDQARASGQIKEYIARAKIKGLEVAPAPKK